METATAITVTATVTTTVTTTETRKQRNIVQAINRGRILLITLFFLLPQIFYYPLAAVIIAPLVTTAISISKIKHPFCYCCKKDGDSNMRKNKGDYKTRRNIKCKLGERSQDVEDTDIHQIDKIGHKEAQDDSEFLYKYVDNDSQLDTNIVFNNAS